LIQSIRIGAGFKGAAAYVLEKEGAVRLTGCGTMGGQDAAMLSREAAAFRALRPGLGKAVFHSSLSLAPGEALSDEQWGDAATWYMAKMGFREAPWFAVRHTDAKHEHIHIVAVRIDVHGKTVSDSHERTRGALALQELEKAWGLTRAAKTPREAKEMNQRPHSRGEAKAFASAMVKAGEGWIMPDDPLNVNGKSEFITFRQVFRAAIDQAAEESKTYPEFMEATKKRGVLVVPNIASTGHVSGISYLHESSGNRFKASALGKAFGFKGVIARGVEYVSDRDSRFLMEPYKHESTHAADRQRAREQRAQEMARQAVEDARSQAEAWIARDEKAREEARERAAFEAETREQVARFAQVRDNLNRLGERAEQRRVEEEAWQVDQKARQEQRERAEVAEREADRRSDEEVVARRAKMDWQLAKGRPDERAALKEAFQASLVVESRDWAPTPERTVAADLLANGAKPRDVLRLLQTPGLDEREVAREMGAAINKLSRAVKEQLGLDDFVSDVLHGKGSPLVRSGTSPRTQAELDLWEPGRTVEKKPEVEQAPESELEVDHDDPPRLEYRMASEVYKEPDEPGWGPSR